MKDKPLRVAPTHGIEHREIARLTAELGIEKLNRKEEIERLTKELDPLRKAFTTEVDRAVAAETEVERLKELLSRTVGPVALEDLRTDLSVARQSLYEVADQRDAFHKEAKWLRRFAECHYMHMDGVCTKCGFPGHEQFDKEGK